ncbi:MAG: hypothetical protein WB439_16310, partial [Acidobacteriaceae bacterium]
STDNIVVGAFLSVGLVAFYSIGGSLTVYSMQVVSSLSTTFTPSASGLDALGKILGILMLQYLWQGCRKMTLAAVPYAAVCAIEDIHWHPASLAVFFVQIGLTLPIYVATVLLVFRKEAMTQFRKWQQSRFTRAAA